MFDIRKLILVLLIGIISTVFVFSVISAVYPQPEWGDYCNERGMKPTPYAQPDAAQVCAPVVVPQEAYAACEGYIDYTYASDGCAIDYNCNLCQVQYEAANDMYQQVVFYVAALFALIAIFAGLYLPAKKNSLNEWIGTGFLLAGTFILLFGTISSYGSLHAYVKPIVMLVELVLVIFLAYKKMHNLK